MNGLTMAVFDPYDLVSVSLIGFALEHQCFLWQTAEAGFRIINYVRTQRIGFTNVDALVQCTRRARQVILAGC